MVAGESNKLEPRLGKWNDEETDDTDRPDPAIVTVSAMAPVLVRETETMAVSEIMIVTARLIVGAVDITTAIRRAVAVGLDDGSGVGKYGWRELVPEGRVERMITRCI